MNGAPPLLAVPNVSEGRDPDLVRHIAGDGALIDLHSDADHNRCVLTYAGSADQLVDITVAMVSRAVATLDLRSHEGVHPRFGVVDVLPFVRYAGDTVTAALAADLAAAGIREAGVPVHRYGLDAVTLPDLRRTLRRPHTAHPTAGVVCVGVRDPLVAFNVNVRDSFDRANGVAASIRGPSIRALALDLPSRGLVQVSMNLTDPLTAGPREAFDEIRSSGLSIVDAEIVGLLPDALAGTLTGIPLAGQARTVAEALGG